MDAAKVVPDVIPAVPPETLKVKFGKVELNMGKELTPTQVKNKPTEVTWKTAENGYYTLCMTDPDAPSREKPSQREWHHWLVVNIPGNDIAKGETLSEYIGSAPPKNSGLHRYVLVVYKQQEKINVSGERKLTNRSGEHRGKFSIHKFAQKYNMGNPIAANFYQARWDDYVPTIYKQLK